MTETTGDADRRSTPASDRVPTTREARTKRIARWLGYGGLFPFLGLAAGYVIGPRGLGTEFAVALAAYAALILAFVGGVSWGSAMAEREAGRIGLSMLPFFLAWLGIVVPPPMSFWILLAGFSLAYLADWRAADQGGTPPWFLTLRRHLSVAVGGVLAFAAVFGGG